jgi:hypothetical protein
MYTADPRYAATYDDIAPGFSSYVHDAMIANADRAQHQAGPGAWPPGECR